MLTFHVRLGNEIASWTQDIIVEIKASLVFMGKWVISLGLSMDVVDSTDIYLGYHTEFIGQLRIWTISAVKRKKKLKEESVVVAFSI